MENKCLISTPIRDIQNRMSLEIKKKYIRIETNLISNYRIGDVALGSDTKIEEYYKFRIYQWNRRDCNLNVNEVFTSSADLQRLMIAKNKKRQAILTACHLLSE